ncbi:hypothetical protein GWI33_007519 [Rhynchophorus ferrugineus]|uniref:Uncharacterized protein n=1 Tax=Rhynchophorus ferrugineus TaxID=354439 RepID=A0A834IEF9_RHYFE|nr:hypothetical protein GWI33_007519 [Rhynchophorus ferrugineus]
MSQAEVILVLNLVQFGKRRVQGQDLARAPEAVQVAVACAFVSADISLCGTVIIPENYEYFDINLYL